MPLPPKTLFVNAEYIKAYSVINGSVDQHLLYPAVYQAQDMDLAPWLGDNLYQRLKSDVDGNALAGDYLTLMDEYVRPALVPYVVLRALTSLAFKIDNGGLVQRTMEDAQPVPQEVVAEMRTEQLRAAEYYALRMGEYLCANSAMFPEYLNNQYPQRPPRRPGSGSVSFGFSRGNSSMGTTGEFPRWQRPKNT